MRVQETIYKMMREYPSLYYSRAAALASLFDATHTKWVNGELIDTDNSGEGRNYLPYSEKEIAEALAKKQDGGNVIFMRRENAKAQFIHDNAELLSQETNSGFKETHCVRLKGLHFDDLPPDVTDDWLAAAKELALSVRIHRYRPYHGYTAEHVKNSQEDFARSQLICTQFLERFKVLTVNPYERAARIQTLMREAQALGLRLVDADGNSPTTAV